MTIRKRRSLGSRAQRARWAGALAATVGCVAGLIAIGDAADRWIFRSDGAAVVGEPRGDARARVTVPSVVGDPIAEAVRDLEGASLSVGHQDRRFSRHPRDQVIGQDPQAGQTAETDTAVALLVSNGTCPLRGRILSPTAGAAVAAGFGASGTLCSQRLGRRHVWTVTEVSGGYFPKEPIARSSRHWRVRVFEEARSFSLVLLVVGRADHRRILGWFERGERTDAFPALPLPTASPLASVELVHR